MSRVVSGAPMLNQIKPTYSTSDPSVVALAVAWHREACALRGLASRQCRYWPFHLASAARIRTMLSEDGWSLALAALLTEGDSR